MESKESRAEVQEKRSMTEAETIAFLQEQGVKPLENFTAHQPLLYVLEERIRKDNGPLKDLPKDKRPSVARVSDPFKIHFDNPLVDEGEPERVVYALDNPGGQVDYYAINPITKEIEIVKTTIGRIKDATSTPYHVRKEGLFMPDD
jgi:hypothetical protein